MADEVRLIDIIKEFISGDWGEENATEDAPCAVSCVRGADIVPISNSRFENIPARYVSVSSLRNRGLSEGDIIIEKSGGSPTQSTGRTVFVSKKLVEAKKNIVCSNFCQAFRIKDGWNPLYVYYYLQVVYNSGVFFNFEGKTSGLKNLILDSAFQSITIKKVPLEEQDRVANLLSLIDDKIAANHAINDYLAAMAKQLYDYWFVQFDFPDENGKPYKSSGGKMVWNERLKREIPEGWECATLQDFLTIKNGRDHKALNEGLFPVYGSGGLMRYVDSYLYNGESVLFPRKGSLNHIMYVNEAFWTVDTMFFTELKIPQAAKYIFYSVNGIDFTGLDSGTGVPSMTSTTLYSIKVIKPTQGLLQLFDERIQPWFHAIESNRRAIEESKKLRDELLPLLMNGQVSVRQAAK